MAGIFTSFQDISNLNPKPTDGEYSMLRFLVDNLDDSYEIYFQPSLNGDRPDIIIMRRGSGAFIIEVKDWVLDHYYCDGRGNFFLKKNNAIIKKSPFDQAKQYKDNIYNLHSEVLLKKHIYNNSIYGVIKCGVYFHNASKAKVQKFISSCDRKTMMNIQNNCIIIGNDSLNTIDFTNILYETYLSRHSNKFDDEIYNELRRNFQPSIQEYEGVGKINFSKKQQKLCMSKPNNQKIKGVAGCGKTLVLAQRALNANIREAGIILILTYNITLKNYIHDKISELKGTVNWGDFTINNYHRFIIFQMNNLGIPFHRDEFINKDESDRLDQIYFSNETLFEKYKDEILKYDAIFIDEAQDYKYEWLKIIKKYFLNENCEFVIFGDEKQNIYSRELEEDKAAKVNIPGKWNVLNDSYRLSTTMTQLILDFQSKYLISKYNVDNIEYVIQTSIEDKKDYLECLYYAEFESNNICDSIYSRIKELNINSNDVCIVAPSIYYLREIDEVIKDNYNEKTEIMFESKEEYKNICNMLNKKYKVDSYSFEEEDDKGYQNELSARLNTIRQGRKFKFWMNSGLIKLATIHSFKGWEINTLVLIIDNTTKTTEELVYTGLTRCIRNLIVINIGNLKYNEFFERYMPIRNNSWNGLNLDAIESDDLPF